MSIKIGIWGFGVVGKSALPYFQKKGILLEVLDKRPLTPDEHLFLQKNHIPYFSQQELPSFLDRNDYILASCGIDLRPYASYSHKWLSELDIFGDEFTGTSIAITGSVGKTTITHLLAQLLQSLGKKAFMGGNIGIGLLDSLEQAQQAEYAVLECSSFQLERTRTFAPHIAIISNIYPNHLDRHGSLQEYITAKLAIAKRQKNSIIFIAPYTLRTAIQECPEFKSRPVVYFSVDKPTDTMFSCLHSNETLFFLHNASLYKYYQTKLDRIYDFCVIPEISYPENILILSIVMTHLALPFDNFSPILNLQELPKHRMEKIATYKHVDFYNDSKSTIPASTLAALEKLKGKSIILFLGGVSKGVCRKEFIKQLTGRVQLVCCFGKEADDLYRYCLEQSIPASKHSGLDEAFNALIPLLKENDAVLFSPAGASFDLYAHYQERGEHFRSLVTQLIQKP